MKKFLLVSLCSLFAFDMSPVQAQDTGAPRLVIESPAPGEVLDGGALIKFRTENISLRPEYGDSAVAKRPAIGHLHVIVDDNPWFWIHDNAEQIIIAGLPAGAHRIKLQLADPNHRVLEEKEVRFSMAGAAAHH